MLPIDKILPSRRAPTALAASKKYKQIQSSIGEVGLIEPLAVCPIADSGGAYALLDGHIRLLVLRDLGVTEVPCLEALDDESYTYNNRLNRLSSIQEHYMIRRAIDRGVSPERLARALNVDVNHLRKKTTLLDGLCPEATGLLEDRQFSAELSRVLRKMKPTRQVECIELMISANNVTVSYAEALLAATPQELLVDERKPRNLRGVTTEQMVRMEREMSNLQGRYRVAEQSYGQDVLTLTIVQGYLTKLLANDEVSKFLQRKAPEIFEQFESIVRATSLEA